MHPVPIGLNILGIVAVELEVEGIIRIDDWFIEPTDAIEMVVVMFGTHVEVVDCEEEVGVDC